MHNLIKVREDGVYTIDGKDRGWGGDLPEVVTTFAAALESKYQLSMTPVLKAEPQDFARPRAGSIYAGFGNDAGEGVNV